MKKKTKKSTVRAYTTPILPISLPSQISVIFTVYASSFPTHSSTYFILASVCSTLLKLTSVTEDLHDAEVNGYCPVFILLWLLSSNLQSIISSSSKPCLTLIPVTSHKLGFPPGSLATSQSVLWAHLPHISLSLGSVLLTWHTGFIYFHGLNYHLYTDGSQIYHHIADCSSHFQISFCLLDM